MENNILNWLQEWYLSQCDGEWEHEYGVKIDTLDNPGWDIKINLQYTDFEDYEIEWKFYNQSENDWFGYKIEDGNFIASGDPTKLSFLLHLFKAIINEEKPIPSILDKLPYKV
jgi:hypothetical protein